MAEIVETIDISRRPGDVFAYAADFSHFPEWQGGVVAARRRGDDPHVRVVGGLGTIARIVSESDEIYRAPLTVGAALERINRLYTPYHATLRALIAEVEAIDRVAVRRLTVAVDVGR